MISIYKLSHSTSDKFYIGKSKNPEYRYKQNVKNNRVDKNYPKYLWIKGLKENGLKPEMKIILEVEDKEWSEWEKCFISAYRLRYGRDRVLNIADGGNEGPSRKGCKLSKEHNNAIKAYQKEFGTFPQQISDETIVEIFKLNHEGLSNSKIGEKLGVSQSHISDILNKKLRYMQDPKWDSYVKQINPRKRTDEEKKAISEFMKGNKHSLGVVPSAETREKISKANKGRTLTTKHKENISKSMMDNSNRRDSVNNKQTHMES